MKNLNEIDLHKQFGLFPSKTNSPDLNCLVKLFQTDKLFPQKKKKEKSNQNESKPKPKSKANRFAYVLLVEYL